ncbi:PEP-utilizing enzyme [Nannocystis exedens]|uniref:PEP-utilizing enzyme n=1 Tax=Nannocystis exedens TaxID=54 RepID=UPI00116070DE|nr:PEP-utilizing enzyme [Nannocystis exedens]
MLVLGDLPGPDAAPKPAVLSRLLRAGLPIPPGLAVAPEALSDRAVRRRLEDLLAGGPVIVRAALAGEDTADAAAAGLGLSVPDCRDLADLDRAATAIAEAAGDPWLLRYGGGPPRYQLLVQRQVERRWLAVAAADRGGARLLELHDAARADALAAGASPGWSGPLALAEPALAAPITSIFDHVASVMSEVPALDLELVVDPTGAVWLVQARPLARPLVPGWPEFCAAVAPGRDHLPDLPGLWKLDGEHNPAVLSPAHAGVVTWLIGQGSGLRVLGGWLYERASSSSRGAGVDPHRALAELRGRHLPAARRALAAFVDDLAGDLRPLLARALEHLRAILALHAEVRVDLPRDLPEPDPRALLSLHDRGDYLDVLPAAWDIASPALADLVDPTCLAREPAGREGQPDGAAEDLQGDRERASDPTGQPQAPPAREPERDPGSEIDPAEPRASPARERERDPGSELEPAEPRASPARGPERDHGAAVDPADPQRAAVLVRELDDHLFALGLAPLRRIYLAAGERLGLGDDIFLLAPDELSLALAGRDLPDLAARRREQQRFAELRPPPALFDGRPLPVSPRRRLGGIGVGSPARGPVARRRDLADLLARPPAPDAVVVLPALTAQAAVALRALGVRAVCCEYGGALSHAALMARELGLSALIGCTGCTELADGLEVELDTRVGRLRVRSPADVLSNR